MSVPANTTHVWEKSDTLKLIELFESHPILWNRSLKGYRDRHLKAATLLFIARKLGVNVGELNRKWHNLRCQLNSELRKIRRRTRGGNGDGNSTWEFFSVLRFMADESQENNKIAGGWMQSGAHDLFQEDVHDGSSNDNETGESQCLEGVETVMDANPAAIERSRPKWYRQPSTSDDDQPMVVEPVAIVEETGGLQPLAYNEASGRAETYGDPLALPESRDDFTTFGDFVASELRQIRSDERRNRLKRIIQKAILETAEDDDLEYFQQQQQTEQQNTNRIRIRRKENL